MSWSVQYLLLNRNEIRSFSGRSDPVQYSDVIPYTDISIDLEEDNLAYEESILENDDYNNLLIVEKKLEELYRNGKIDDKEISVIKLLSLGKSYREVGSELIMDHRTVKNVFQIVCDRISFALGGVFTDEGYLEYMKEKHNLPPFAVDNLIRIIEENKRI